MPIHAGQLYWPTTMNEANPIQNHIADKTYDAVIIGGGMSGALTALSLVNEGMTVAVVEKEEFAYGSTAANTGLLQYSNDIMLHELIEQIGEEKAVAFYRLCYDALKDLQEAAEQLPIDPAFITRPSLYYASDENDLMKIQKEYKALSKHDFPCEYWDRPALLDKTGIDKPGALWTCGDAEVNPFKLVRGILQLIQSQGADVHDCLEVEDVRDEEGILHILTSSGSIKARNVIFTTGYIKPPVGKLTGDIIKRSYVAVSKPVEQPAWYENAMIWETKRPYLYMRTAVDGRIIIGGLDEETDQMDISQEKIQEKADELIAEANKLIPGLQLEVDMAYCALFGESKDELPFIGRHPEKPNHYYLLGFGGNGTVYSMLGSKMLADLIQGKEPAYSDIVGLDRSVPGTEEAIIR
ncbi:NAD(P)/FAD-dependent oxidoreductase [Sporosarcina cyprini]|uniref:NAD(P)/FAD-dependent oxidoreductase n=1 Tax=Sporosarcina cyprini TaxID=2910523 RepID=UPI001EDE5EED|nr:FAD-dependent oxidoreductase [Sporosarcina cyprini]MCG3088548.1 FAD-binding oxidoreductase [Sporosarcina cyprini]